MRGANTNNYIYPTFFTNKSVYYRHMHIDLNIPLFATDFYSSTYFVLFEHKHITLSKNVNILKNIAEVNNVYTGLCAI